MQEQLISFETAKLAQEKGFDVLTDFEYIDNGQLVERRHCYQNRLCSAPTLSLLQKWLRDKHKCHIILSSLDEDSWKYHIPNIGGHNNFSTYEKALEAGLINALKLI